MDEPRDNLADIWDAKGAPFDAGGASFRIRPPSTEEYDDAMAIERMVVKRWLSDPALQPLKDEPCSDTERAMYEAMIAQADERFREAEDGSPEKDGLLDRIATLQRTLAKRTLADEIASDRATLARDRYLCQRLLTDEQGKPVLDLRAKDFADRWEALPLAVKNGARPAIWTVLAQVRNAPFSWDRLRAPRPA